MVKKNGIGQFSSTYPLEASKKSFSIYYDNGSKFWILYNISLTLNYSLFCNYLDSFFKKL